MTLRASVALAALTLLLVNVSLIGRAAAQDALPIPLGSGAMIESMSDKATLVTLPPRQVPHSDALPGQVRFPTIIREGEDQRRMWGVANGRPVYAQSTDGEIWRRDDDALHLPDLSLQSCSIVVDQRPALDRLEPRYKALGCDDTGRLHTLSSTDGLRWRREGDGPSTTSAAAGASIVWSDAGRHFLAIWSEPRGAMQVLMRSTSIDFRSWSEPEQLHLNAQGEDLWCATLLPIESGPPLLMALLTRTAVGQPHGADICLAMSHDGGVTFQRPTYDAWVRPTDATAHWSTQCPSVPVDVAANRFRVPEQFFYSGGRRFHVFRNRLVAIRAQQMKAAWPEDVPDAWEPAVVVTRPFVLTGNTLQLDMSTNALGGITVEILDRSGNVIPGYEHTRSMDLGAWWVDVIGGRIIVPNNQDRSDAADGLIGDGSAIQVAWRFRHRGVPTDRKRMQIWPDPDLSALSGQTVRLRFIMHGADLFSFSTPVRPPHEGEPVEH